MKNTIDVEDLQTAQEYWLIGSTPEVRPSEERDWYIPQGVLRGVLTIEDAIKLRKAVGHFESGMLSTILGFRDRPISVGFSDINRETNMTLNDPKIIGLWDEDKLAIVKTEGRDLTQEVYRKFRELKVNLHLREPLTKKERIDNSSERKA